LKHFHVRQSRLALACLGALFLAACQTASVHTPGESAGASSAGVPYLAEIRATYDLPALSYDPILEETALDQATNMARRGRMTHTTGWGKDFASRIHGKGIYVAAAENVAYGRMDLDELFGAWMKSQGHRENILDPRFSRFGLAYVRDSAGSERRYWALVVAR
jgi:uncharacterized protein YkwD